MRLYKDTIIFRFVMCTKMNICVRVGGCIITLKIDTSDISVRCVTCLAVYFCIIRVYARNWWRLVLWAMRNGCGDVIVARVRVELKLRLVRVEISAVAWAALYDCAVGVPDRDWWFGWGLWGTVECIVGWFGWRCLGLRSDRWCRSISGRTYWCCWNGCTGRRRMKGRWLGWSNDRCSRVRKILWRHSRMISPESS